MPCRSSEDAIDETMRKLDIAMAVFWCVALMALLLVGAWWWLS